MHMSKFLSVISAAIDFIVELNIYVSSFHIFVDIFSDAINRLVCLTETTVASGDDEGCIKVFNIVSV